jgi:hypothetical protein
MIEAGAKTREAWKGCPGQAQGPIGFEAGRVSTLLSPRGRGDLSVGNGRSSDAQDRTGPDLSKIAVGRLSLCFKVHLSSLCLGKLIR